MFNVDMLICCMLICLYVDMLYVDMLYVLCCMCYVEVGGKDRMFFYSVQVFW